VAGKAVLPGGRRDFEPPFHRPLFQVATSRVVTITRQRDETWDRFLRAVEEDSLILIAPEGRMNARPGLDKDGKEMTVRGGIADVLFPMTRGDFNRL